MLWRPGRREQLDIWAQSMCFVAWSDGFLSLNGSLQQEYLSSALGPSVLWLLSSLWCAAGAFPSRIPPGEQERLGTLASLNPCSFRVLIQMGW